MDDAAAIEKCQNGERDAFRAIKQFERARKFYPWFYVLLRYRCYKMARRKRETEFIEETKILAPQADVSHEERFALEAALIALTEEEREAVTLKYLDGLSYEELAERLQIPKGTVMSRLFYARKHLRAKLTGKFY